MGYDWDIMVYIGQTDRNINARWPRGRPVLEPLIRTTVLISTRNHLQLVNFNECACIAL